MTEIHKNLNNYIVTEMDYWDFSGIIRIIQNGQIIFETSRGYSNIEFSIKNTMETRFTVASVAKQFTAFAIMILYDKGLIRLDEKANRYLPSNMQLPSEITVHQLLSHTSGLHNNYIKREDVYLTTKLWVSNASFEKAEKAIDHDLKELKTDYIDLMLLHQPYGDVYGAWNALSAAKRAGKIRSIGLSNFYPDLYMNLELAHEDKPALNQIEINPWFQQTNDVKFFQGRDVAVEAWAPFAEGKEDIFNNDVLKEIAANHRKTVGQVILRWLVQRSIIVIPKSVHDKRQKENMDIFDFELTREEMEQIKHLDKGVSQFFDHRDPAVIDNIFGESLKQLRDSE